MHASQHSVPCATSGPCRQASMVENAEQHQPQPRLILLVHSNFLRYLLEVMQFQQEPGVLQPSGQSSLGKPSVLHYNSNVSKELQQGVGSHAIEDPM